VAGFQRIGIAVKAGRPDAGPLVRRVAARVREAKVELGLDLEAARLLGTADGRPLDALVDAVDLLMALGGDGSVLAAARAIDRRSVPIFGINLGRLGFLTQVGPEELDAALGRLFAGDFRIETRARLEVSKCSGEVEERGALVLNDAVLSHGASVARMIELEARIEGRTVVRYRADGLIVATPTGSTAYNLSAGGPILDPELAGMILNPICPHTLSQRPLVLDPARTVEIAVASPAALLTLDGQVGSPLGPGDVVRVRAASHPTHFVALHGSDPFVTLHRKLGWGRE
jgi:NAD+ kinase